jgi:hypothetical protein
VLGGVELMLKMTDDAVADYTRVTDGRSSLSVKYSSLYRSMRESLCVCV